MTLDVSSVDISKMTAILRQNKKGHKMYILFTLWPYSIVLHGLSAVYDINVIHIAKKWTYYIYLQNCSFYGHFDVKMTAILEMSTELTYKVSITFQNSQGSFSYVDLGCAHP